MKVIVLRCVDQGEKNLIASVLTEGGQIISALFFGAKGGGKRKSTQLVVPGYCLECEFTRGKGDLEKAKEWKLVWAPYDLRYSYQAHACSCFMLDVIQRTSPRADLDSLMSEDAAIYRTLANALHALDQDAKGRKVDWSDTSARFLRGCLCFTVLLWILSFVKFVRALLEFPPPVHLPPGWPAKAVRNKLIQVIRPFFICFSKRPKGNIKTYSIEWICSSTQG